MYSVHFGASIQKVHERMIFTIKKLIFFFSSGSWGAQPIEAKYMPDAGMLVLLLALSKCTN